MPNPPSLFVEKEMYYKELAHVIMNGEKSEIYS